MCAQVLERVEGFGGILACWLHASQRASQLPFSSLHSLKEELCSPLGSSLTRHENESFSFPWQR